MERVDKVLMKMGLARSRTHATDLIQKKLVYFSDNLVTKASQKVTTAELRVEKDSEDFVGRGALKLVGALKEFDIDPKNLICADVGASTGGFTDVLLRSGAVKVYAIDVGHDQLALPLVNDSRVSNREGVNIRNGVQLPEKVQLVVADLSFISLKLVLEPMFSLLDESGVAVVLIKPQFEVGRKGIDKNGIVKDKSLHSKILKEIRDHALGLDYSLQKLMESPVKGRTGNIEYLVLFVKDELDRVMNDEQIEEKVRSQF